MQATTTRPPVRHRRPHRLGIDAHTNFVATLVSELDSAVAGLQAVEFGDPSDRDRSIGDVLRLVRLLETIDGPDELHHLQPINLGDATVRAAKGLDIEVTLRGEPGDARFHGVADSFQLGMEMVLMAFVRAGEPVQIDLPGDHVVVVQGAFDPSDERRAWQLRCGRRVLEGENCRVRLTGRRGHYRLEIRVEP